MGTLKSFAALLLSVAALLTSVLALNAAQKKAEMQKAAAQTVTKAVVAAQEETALASALDSDTCEAKLLGIQVLNTEVGTLDATVSTAGPLGAIEAKLKPEKEESEEKKPDGTYEYETQVTYWMPFNGGIGFHDATWQAYFGGDRYTYAGSHGCINMPLDAAATLYSIIDTNVPIVCFY